MKIVIVSDTHNKYPEIPLADVVIHAGDYTYTGTVQELRDFTTWYSSLPHKYKILIAGNHELELERQPQLKQELFQDMIYLEDSEYVLPNGLRVYGSPWEPKLAKWAFHRQEKSRKSTHPLNNIPETDILVTHVPPREIQDTCWDGRKVGSKLLARHYTRIENKPKLHVFGHIHESKGITYKYGTHFINASYMDKSYNPHTLPFYVVEIDDETHEVISIENVGSPDVSVST